MKKFTLILLLLFASSCAMRYKYQKLGYFKSSGYDDVEITENSYKIIYATSGGDLKKAVDLLLLRSSQIALEKGARYFELKPDNFLFSYHKETGEVINLIVRGKLELLQGESRVDEVFNSYAICNLYLRDHYNNFLKGDVVDEVSCNKIIDDEMREKYSAKIKNYYKVFYKKLPKNLEKQIQATL